jgi:CheY-like chemotaxis protein
MPNMQIKMLIVDDDPTMRLLMTHIFADLGHSVRSAEDGFSALAAIRQDMPSILLSDLNMPGMSGFELISVVRRRFPAIRVIAMSGAFSGDSVQPGVPADAFYEKASNLQTLLQIVGDSSHPERSSFDHANTILPIWIPRNGHDSSGVAYVTIACPECLRTFPRVLGKATGNIYETDCVHCHSLIHYAIVEPTDPASPQAFQRKPNAETASTNIQHIGSAS